MRCSWFLMSHLPFIICSSFRKLILHIRRSYFFSWPVNQLNVALMRGPLTSHTDTHQLFFGSWVTGQCQLRAVYLCCCVTPQSLRFGLQPSVSDMSKRVAHKEAQNWDVRLHIAYPTAVHSQTRDSRNAPCMMGFLMLPFHPTSCSKPLILSA